AADDPHRLLRPQLLHARRAARRAPRRPPARADARARRAPRLRTRPSDRLALGGRAGLAEVEHGPLAHARDRRRRLRTGEVRVVGEHVVERRTVGDVVDQQRPAAVGQRSRHPQRTRGVQAGEVGPVRRAHREAVVVVLVERELHDGDRHERTLAPHAASGATMSTAHELVPTYRPRTAHRTRSARRYEVALRTGPGAVTPSRAQRPSGTSASARALAARWCAVSDMRSIQASTTAETMKARWMSVCHSMSVSVGGSIPSMTYPEAMNVRSRWIEEMPTMLIASFVLRTLALTWLSHSGWAGWPSIRSRDTKVS